MQSFHLTKYNIQINHNIDLQNLFKTCMNDLSAKKALENFFVEKAILNDLVEMFIEYDNQLALCPNMCKHGEKKLE